MWLRSHENGEAHSLFLIYSYNPHDPDFNRCFEAYYFEILRNALSICAHCHATADTAMHTLFFCASWAQEDFIFSAIGARCP